MKFATNDSLKTAGFKIPLFGTFDVDNYGDCLFPLIVEYHLKKRLDRVTVYPFSPTNRVAKIGNYSRVYGFNELSELFSCEPPSCFIIGGGELIRTGYGPSLYPSCRKILYPFSLKTWLLPIMIAEAWHCTSVLNPVGMGQVFDDDFNELSEKYLKTLSLCLVRDPFTAERLSKLHVESEVVPECAFSISEIFPPEKLKNHYDEIAKEFSIPEKFIVVQCSLYKFQTAFTHAVAQAAQSINLPVVLLPICHYASDLESLKIMQKSLKRRGVKVHLINRYLDTIQTTSILSRSALFIGTSLHGAIVTLAYKHPVISFNPNKKSKHEGVLSVVDLKNCYVSGINEIKYRAQKIYTMHPDFWDNKIIQANHRINNYFDRMSHLIAVGNNSSIPCDWTQDLVTGEINYKSVGDFGKLNRLCVIKRRQVSDLKRIMYYVIRRNNRVSGCYDRLMFWLRNHRIVSFEYKDLKNRR